MPVDGWDFPMPSPIILIIIPIIASMYGSLTTIVLFMLWLYFCMYILFIGAEINLLFQNKALGLT